MQLYLWLTFLALIIIFIYDYNKLIRLNQNVNEGWSGIDVQLKRRRDLIPELVKLASFYAKHEKDTFSRIAELRTSAQTAQNVEQLATAETEITSGLQNLFALTITLSINLIRRFQQPVRCCTCIPHYAGTQWISCC